ncbi:MAG TPA: M42 family metallopeptidase [Firmicutes bacterium]|nr:M42 family metallopeptidase [Bacillota bacterium]
MKDTLARLSQTYGPSGREEEIRSQLCKELTALEKNLHLKTDALGNLIATRPGGEKRLLLAAHMDEIALLVTHIDDSGFLRFTPVGGHDPRILLGARVVFADGTVGTIGREKLKDKEELKLDKLFIDIGAASKAEAEESCPIGSMAVFAPHFSVQGHRLMGKALDNRASCTVLLEVIRNLPPVDYQIDFVFTVQEEVGLRGARTAAYQLQPDLALVVDVTRTGDTPEAPVMAVKLGKGPAIKVKDRSFISHPRVKDLLEETARLHGIPYQLEILERGGTDAGSIHLTGEGIPTGVISLPTRYIHSPAEIIDYRDLQNSVDLLCSFLQHRDLFSSL